MSTYMVGCLHSIPLNHLSFTGVSFELSRDPPRLWKFQLAIPPFQPLRISPSEIGTTSSYLNNYNLLHLWRGRAEIFPAHYHFNYWTPRTLSKLIAKMES